MYVSIKRKFVKTADALPADSVREENFESLSYESVHSEMTSVSVVRVANCSRRGKARFPYRWSRTHGALLDGQ